MTLLGLAMTMCSLFSLHAAVLTGVDPTIFSVGKGKDISYLVIDESSLYATPLEPITTPTTVIILSLVMIC